MTHTDLTLTWMLDVMPFSPPWLIRCGLRFDSEERMEKHMDYHFQQNRRERERDERPICRQYFLTREVQPTR